MATRSRLLALVASGLAVCGVTVVAEALANVQKHAGASRVLVRAAADDQRLVMVVDDDGIGGADEAGSGLRGLADRVDALSGRLTIESPAGGGTRLRAEIPLAPAVPRGADYESSPDGP